MASADSEMDSKPRSIGYAEELAAMSEAERARIHDLQRPLQAV